MNTSSPSRFNSLMCVAAVAAALAVLSGCSSSGRTGFGFGGVSSATPGGLGAGAGGGGGADGGGAAGGGGVVVGGGGTPPDNNGGTPPGNDGGSPNPGAPSPSPAIVASNTLIGNVGNTTSAVGGLVGGIQAGPATGLLNNTGNAVDTLGQGVTNGLGRLDQPNAVGVTVDSVPVAVGQIGDGVASVGAGTPLAPVTGTVGAVVNKTADLVAGVTDNGVVRQVTGGVSTAVQKIDGGLITVTQKVGAVTGLGAPIDGLTGKLGDGIATLGGKLPGEQTNGVTNALGTTVASVGGLVNAPGSTSSGLGGGLLGGLTSGGGLAGGSGSGLGAVTAGVGAGAGVSASPGGVNAGLGVGAVAGITAPVTTVLAPVTNIVTPVVAPVVAVVTPVVSTVVAPVLTTVTPVVSTVVGGTVATVGGITGGLLGGLGIGGRNK